MNFPCGPLDTIQLIAFILFGLLTIQCLLGIGLGIGFLLQPPVYNTVVSLNSAFNKQAYFSIYARRFSLHRTYPERFLTLVSSSFSSYSPDHRQWFSSPTNYSRNLWYPSTSMAISNALSCFTFSLYGVFIGCCCLRFRLFRSTETKSSK